MCGLNFDFFFTNRIKMDLRIIFIVKISTQNFKTMTYELNQFLICHLSVGFEPNSTLWMNWAKVLCIFWHVSRKIFDMDSRGNSMSQIGCSLLQIDTKFRDYSMSFIQALFVFRTWHGFWTSSSHGISMAFTKKMMGFSSDLVFFVIFDQTAVDLWHEISSRIHVTFFAG